ncbi:GTP-binding protein [Amycolatopsis sp. NPDC049868]|uniref:GTP-binding protein n=1 Tax=Amycolatopsis sp. NPDC049868 TaxID=3363934 RepID=UPI0037A10A75
MSLTLPANEPISAAKIVVAGGPGAGTTTFIDSVSDIKSRPTEPVAMDFGHTALGDDLQLYLFGAPDKEQFRFMWGGLVRGAVGAVVLVDSRHVAAASTAISFLEAHRTPYVIVVNLFDEVDQLPDKSIREGLALARRVPILRCDVRRTTEVKETILGLVDYALETLDLFEADRFTVGETAEEA